MAVITRIDGVPLFSSIQEALRWGRFNRLKPGYHIHNFEGQKGYMAGNNHSALARKRPMKFDATLVPIKQQPIAPPVIPVRPEQQEPLEQIIRPVRTVRPVLPEETEIPTRRTPRRTTSGGSGGGSYSGGGGGGGY